MAQYGELTVAEQSLFDEYMLRTVREPTSSVWLAAQGDIDNYVMEISISRRLESDRGPGNIAIGRAEIKLDNIDGTFFADGESTIEVNSKIKVWLGFKSLNIPEFTGVVRSVTPEFGDNTVTLSCADYMILFLEDEISGSQGSNNSAKLMLESFCLNIRAQSNVGTDTELTSTFDSTFFDRQSMLRTVEDIQNSIFHVSWFDESGVLQIKEREYKNPVDWVFTKDRADRDGVSILSPTTIINNLHYEYAENFYSQYRDQASIDTNSEHRRSTRNLVTNSEEISSKLHGLTEFEISNDLEAMKITSSADSAILDNIHLKLSQWDASGNIYVSLYSDDDGSPDSSLGTCQAKASGNLSETFAWIAFYFRAPVEIEPDTDYWIVINVSGVTGTIYGEFSAASISGLYAVYDVGWTLEDNKQLLHEMRGSIEAARVTGDKIRFYKDPKDRLRITGKAVPQLQMLDEVDVDVELDEGSIIGKYTIEEIKHDSNLEEYSTTYTMYKTG